MHRRPRGLDRRIVVAGGKLPTRQSQPSRTVGGGSFRQRLQQRADQFWRTAERQHRGYQLQKLQGALDACIAMLHRRRPHQDDNVALDLSRLVE